jgi:hypothetical protein
MATSYTYSLLVVVVVAARTLRTYAVAVVAGLCYGYSDTRPYSTLQLI